MSIIYLSIGTNLGNRKKNIETAILHISTFAKVLKVSSVYKTSPVGKTNQPFFYNCVVMIQTDYSPIKLIKKLNQIEKLMRRKKVEKWGPRIIDLDILFYDDKIIKTKTLIIPHKELHKRKFVLYPMTELSPNFVHPILKKKIITLKNLLTDRTQKIKRI